MSVNEPNPVLIPPTSPKRYVSFLHGLNIREPLEDTGDWHFRALWFQMKNDPSHRSIALAGEGGCPVNTNPLLGTLGVREMGEVIFKGKLTETRRDIYVANHYRAIADLFAASLLRPRSLKELQRKLAYQEINSWLDTEDQIALLKCDYLEPLIEFEGLTERSTVRQWLDGLDYE